ncbi:MAG: MFS transporter, partial [Candidatus Bathyarchaeia archaeon]
AISRLSKPGSVSKMIGLHNALGSLGATIGLFSLSILVGNIGWRFVYLLWSIPTLVWCVAILSYEEDRVVKSAKRTNVMDLKSVLNFKFALLLSMIAFRDFGASAITTFITTYMVNVRGLSQEVASMVFGLGPLIGVLSSIMGGYLSSRFGDAKTLFWMMVCSVFSLILLITTEGLGLLLHTYLLYSFFNNSVWSPIGSLVAALTQSSKRGAGYSIYFFVEGTVTTIQPLITAVAINYTSFYVIFPIGIGFTSICAVLLGCFYQYFKSP